MKLTDEQWALVVANRHRVAQVARRWWHGNGDLPEVEDAAMWGLIRAASRSGESQDFGAFSASYMDLAARCAARRVARRRESPAPFLSWVAESADRPDPSPSPGHFDPLFDGLTHREKEAARLRYFEGARIDDVAEYLGVPHATAYAVVQQARRKLTVSLRDRLPRRHSMPSQEPSGYVSGEVQYVIRWDMDGRPFFVSSFGWPHLSFHPDNARKFATVADAVCYIEAENLTDSCKVVPELNPERVVYPSPGGPRE